MRCFGCLNERELIAARPDGRQLNAGQTLARIQSGGDLFDAVLLSGGEFLLGRTADIQRFLERIRSVFDGKVVVYTNGTFPRKLRLLLEKRLLDGVHVDMKLPYHCLDPEEDPRIYEAILGIVPSRRRCGEMLESVELVVRHNSPLSQVRTVRYPQLDDGSIGRIRSYVNELNRKHGSNVPYRLNPFYPPHEVHSIHS